MPAPPPTLRSEGHRAKLVHIEDNLDNRMLVRAILEAEGYTVVDAEDGLTGIQVAIREAPDLILLDVNLPGVDGYEVVALLKSFPAFATTPIIAVTAYAMEGDRQRSLVAGCDGYIQKPIDIDAFPRQVAEFLGGKREKIEAREEAPYLRELNQRLVYRLVNQVEELKRLNDHFVRRAGQLADLHRVVQDITSDAGVQAMLERLLPALARALGSRSLTVTLPDAELRVSADGGGGDGERSASVLDGSGVPAAEAWTEVDWTLPLTARGRPLGQMVARHVLPPGAKADEEQLLNIVANQVAIAVDNARLYEGVVRRALEQQSLVAAGRLLAGTLNLSDVLARFTELARSRLGVDVVRIWLEEAPQHFRLCAQAGLAERPAEPRRFAAGEGIVGWVMEHLAPLAIPAFQVDPRLREREWAKAEGLQSCLAVPLMLDERALGVLVALSRQPRDFSNDDVALGQALGTSAAVAIRNARLYEETQLRLRHNETLVAVSQGIGSTLDLTEILRRTTREMVRALGADVGAAWLLAPERDRFVPLVGYHLPKEHLQTLAATSVRLDDALFTSAQDLKEPMYAEDSGADPRFQRNPLGAIVPHKSVLVQPMFSRGEVTGAFSVVWTREPHRFTPEELRLVEGIALQSAVAVENARLYEGVKAQMAELKRTHAQLIQSTKLAAIGELAANVAHEINNPLTTVLGFASFLAEKLEPDHPMREELGLIQDEASRARDIVRDLLQFSRQRDFTPEPSDINAVVEQTVAMLKRQGVLNAVQLRCELAPDLPPISIDASRIKQVFLNIMNNAVYVMPNGGTLGVRTGRHGDTIHIAFEDTGPGILPEHRHRIFDPFFTTKPEVSGTGLGLSVSLGIVQTHGGKIELETEVGRGTTFTVVLPLAAELAKTST